MPKSFPERILVTGAAGQVGWELLRCLAPLGEVVGLDRRQLDLADTDAIRRTVRDIGPGLIINAAAYTAVDKAESQPELAMAINGVAPGVFAEEAKRLGAALVHYSTDYVFDGAKSGPYTETDGPNPLSVYGRTKLAGEQTIQATGASHLIFRTSWVYGMRGSNFLLTMRRLAAERDVLRIVNDQVGAPTWSRLLAETTAQILVEFCASRRQRADSLADVSGIYHMTCGEQTSWHGFAQMIFERLVAAGDPLITKVPNLVPIPSDDYPAPAQRPRNSCLSNARLFATFGLRLPTWKQALGLCVEELRREC
jgi:dTDP-4-dehydrorhamnose reductase